MINGPNPGAATSSPSSDKENKTNSDTPSSPEGSPSKWQPPRVSTKCIRDDIKSSGKFAFFTRLKIKGEGVKGTLRKNYH